MKHIIFLLLVLPLGLLAQTSREGLYIGASAGFSHYATYWYYYRSDARPRHENYPKHSISRVMLSLAVDKKSFLKKDNFHFDLGAELLLGFGGKSIGEWIATDPVISGGGWAVGLAGSFKAVYPLVSGKDQPVIAPFFGLGPQVLMLHNNGKNVEEMAEAPYYNYTDGWNEFLFHLQGTAGVDIHLSSFTLTPELRFGVLGFSTTDWSPNESGVEGDGMPGMIGFGVKIAKKL